MERRNVTHTVAVVLFGVGALLAASLPATAAPGAAGVSTDQSAALQRDLGVPASALPSQQAREAAAVQRAASLDGLLGKSFAGSWLDPTGRLVVGTTDASEVESIEAAGARASVLGRSLDSLDAVMATLDGRASSVPAAVTGWYVEPASNSVVVRATDPAAAESFAGDLGAVRVEQVDQTPQLMADLVGGEELIEQNGARCSIGFSVTNAATAFVLTAGHCTSRGGVWSGPGMIPIGPVERTSYPGDDYGLVRVDNPVWRPSPLAAGSRGPFAVTGAVPAPVGASVCSSGSTSGLTCGRLLAADQTVNYGNGNVVSDLLRTDICSRTGDSGGPLVAGTEAQGVLSGGTTCFLIFRGESYFQPVGEVLAANGLSLVTG